MITLFDGMERMTEDQLRYEIALLETISVTGFAREQAMKVKKTSIQLANRVTGLFGGAELTEPAVLTMEGQVAMAEEAMNGKSREELQSILTGALCSRLESLGIPKAASMAKEQLSVLTFAEAAKSIDQIPAYMTPLYKAEAIADKNEKKKPADFEKTILSGKLSRELLAQLVQSCVQAYGEKTAPVLCSMPSYLTGEAMERYCEEERKAHEAMEENAAFVNERTALEHAMDMNQDLAMTQKSTYQSLEEKEDYLLTKETSGEDHESVESMLAETRARMEEALEKQKQYEEEYYAKQVELELLEQKNEAADSVMSQMVNDRTERLTTLWQQAFPKCDFKEGVINGVVRNFYYQELIGLEEALTELCSAEKAHFIDDDPSDDELYYVCRFGMNTGYCGRIAFHEKGDRILILQIQKSKGKKI